MGCTLDKDNYGHEFVSILHEGVQVRPLGRQFPTLVNTMLDLPSWIAVKMNKAMAGIVAWMEGLERMIDAVKAEKASAKSTKDSSKRTVFHEPLEKGLPLEEKDTKTLQGSAANFLGAGTETTARTLAVTCFYLLRSREMLDKLRRELKGVLPTRSSRPSLPSLETLSYLVSACPQLSNVDADSQLTERRHQRRLEMCAWCQRSPA